MPEYPAFISIVESHKNDKKTKIDVYMTKASSFYMQ